MRMRVGIKEKVSRVCKRNRCCLGREPSRLGFPRARDGPSLLEPRLEPHVDVIERGAVYAVHVVVQGDERRAVFTFGVGHLFESVRQGAAAKLDRVERDRALAEGISVALNESRGLEVGRRSERTKRMPSPREVRTDAPAASVSRAPDSAARGSSPAISSFRAQSRTEMGSLPPRGSASTASLPQKAAGTPRVPVARSAPPTPQ